MNTSEFEHKENNNEPLEVSSLPTEILIPDVPEDFTAEDLAFAAELNAFFSPEEEGLPPCYVQTLLDMEDERFEPHGRNANGKRTPLSTQGKRMVNERANKLIAEAAATAHAKANHEERERQKLLRRRLYGIVPAGMNALRD